ncbi:nucleotidyltransferase domain-containing protein [bacterium]|nr:nucleotidyltransferase domain-containing protein [bacterium]
MEKEIDELKKEFIKTLNPLKIYLFGSFANGKNNKDSDLDFYIIVKNSIEEISKITTQAYKSIRNIKKRPIDILVSTEETFEKNKILPSIEYEVANKGILIYG